eukprot:4353449-Prymnesium_polylepis.1
MSAFQHDPWLSIQVPPASNISRLLRGVDWRRSGLSPRRCDGAMRQPDGAGRGWSVCGGMCVTAERLNSDCAAARRLRPRAHDR